MCVILYYMLVNSPMHEKQHSTVFKNIVFYDNLDLQLSPNAHSKRPWASHLTQGLQEFVS